jgi:coatomer subunit gamma
MIHSFERFFKTAIVDRNPSISSAALVSSYHLFHGSKEVIRRWANEVQEAINNKNTGSSLFGNNSSITSSYFGFGSSSQPITPSYQVIQSTSYIAQYHGIGLLHSIKQQDRMALIKMIQQLGGGKSGGGTTLKNPLALCILIRYAAKVMEEDPK